jgi:hypothetical protein
MTRTEIEDLFKDVDLGECSGLRPEESPKASEAAQDKRADQEKKA